MRSIFYVVLTLFCNTIIAQQILTFKDQKNLVPEGIAIDTATGNIFITSIAQKKIIKILPDGRTQDFIGSGQDNFLEGLGLEVDLKKQQLWALSNVRKGNAFTSQIHAFDLRSGKTIHSFSKADTIPTLFNDLVIDESGRLIITDTYSSSICSYDPKTKKLDILFKDTSKLKWPNGIEFLGRNHVIVATYGKGMVKMDMQTKAVNPILGYTDRAIAYGLDGLAVYGNHVFGVYNAGRDGYPSNALVKYTMDEKRERIIAEEVIAKGHAAFADPTTAAIYKNTVYVIANSHLDDFNKNKESVAGIESLLTPLKLWVLPF